MAESKNAAAVCDTQKPPLNSPSFGSGESRRDFFARFGRLLLIIAAQNVVVYGVNLLDNVMIGRLGEASEVALSGVFIVNQIQFLLQMICVGIADGVSVLVSRYWGENNIPGIKKACACSMHFALAASLIMMAAVYIFPRGVLSLFSDKPYVIEEGVKYMLLVAPTYVFFAATQVLLGVLRSVECSFIGFVTSCAALVTNLTLNYLLIYGHMGFPALGIRGAAVATLISRLVEFAIVIVYLAVYDKRIRLSVRDFLASDSDTTKKFIKVSVPVLMSAASWGVAMGLQTAILGRLADSVISANSIASTVYQIMSVFISGAATASAIMVGKMIGQAGAEGVPYDALLRETKVRCNILQLIFISTGIITGILLYFSRSAIISLYEISEETREVAMQFMAILSVTAVGTSYEMTCLTGIVRGGGDTKFVFYNDIVFMWCIVLPCSFIAAFVLKLSPAYIFITLKADQILKCFVAVFKVNRYKWIKKF